MSTSAAPPRIAIIGGGPAGLMAAEVFANAGLTVEVFDAMPSVARKFLLAGKGGMNITHAEPFEDFLSRYGDRQAELRPILDAFPPNALRDWIHGLGIETFVGSSGRVFPTDMKAAPLLRVWLHRLRSAGVIFNPRHRWLGWANAQTSSVLRFTNPQGERLVTADIVLLALGGASWAKLGSDGAWIPLLADAGVDISPLRPANCGFERHWSEHFQQRFAGEPVKGIAARVKNGDGASLTDTFKRGEFLITEHGIEGSLVYALSAKLRDEIIAHGQATLELDLLPNHSLNQVTTEITHPRGARSLSSHLQSRLGLNGVRANLLREILGTEGMADAQQLATAIKALPLCLTAPRPIDEAISSAGGVRFSALDQHLMLKTLPGTFCAGEMLDWEAPTGGYLLTASFATGRAAAKGALIWLKQVRGTAN